MEVFHANHQKKYLTIIIGIASLLILVGCADMLEGEIVNTTDKRMTLIMKYNDGRQVDFIFHPKEEMLLRKLPGKKLTELYVVSPLSNIGTNSLGVIDVEDIRSRVGGDPYTFTFSSNHCSVSSFEDTSHSITNYYWTSGK